jgi:PAS domain S-box-containing protein
MGSGGGKVEAGRDGRALKLLLEEIPGLAWSTDRSLRIECTAGGSDSSPRWLPPIGASIAEVTAGAEAAQPLVAAHTRALEGVSSTFRVEIGGRCWQIRVETARGVEGDALGCLGVALDVTDRVRAEARLSESESRLVEAQRIAHIGSWEWSVETNRVLWSDELYRIYGLRQDQFAGTYEAFLERVAPEEREYTRQVVFDAFRKVQPFTYDHRIVRPDGEVRTLHTRGDVIADSHGKVQRMVGACWDITEQVLATKSLETSVSLLRATLESTADGLLITDRAGHVVAFNQRLLDLWKLRPEMVEGQEFEVLLNRVHNQLENGDECLHNVHRYAAQPEMEGFDCLRFHDGRVFERYSRPQRVGSEIIGRVWSYRDVTERERLLRGALFLSDASRLLASLDAEKALDAVARLALAEFCRACAVDLLTDGQPRRLLVLARNPRETISQHFSKSLTHESSIYSIGGSSCIKVPLTAHGEPLGMMSFAAPGERLYVASDLSLAEELARRVELSLENARLYRNAEEALAARDEFLAIAAHELRGPLTSLQLAVQGLGQAPPAAAATQMLSVVEREERRIARFVDELLDVARIRSGQMRFVLAPVDLVEVARQATARLSGELARAGSTLSMTAPGELVGSWDRARLDQVVSNLLSNAIKFGLGNPISLRIDSDGDSARLAITDGGIGVAADAQRRIFTPFERAVSARHYGGLGLGLYIVQTIVEGLQGNVSVDSAPQRGSTFTVTLPLRRRL